MNLVDVVLLASFSPLILILLLHTVYILSAKDLRDSPPNQSGRPKITVSVVIPIKSEPIDLVVEGVAYLGKTVKNLGDRLRIFIVSDDDEEYIKALRRAIDSLMLDVPVEVVKPNSSGGRVGALNYALNNLVNTDTLVVLDVDARPSEEFFDELLACIQKSSACVAHWVGYWTRDTRIARALAFSTELVAESLYKGRQSLGLLMFPLGSGTFFSTHELRTVGGWESGTMQDDVIIGLKLHGAGYRVGYSGQAILRVLVPSSYRAFRIQQLKWAYGSLESLRYSFKYLNRRIGLLKALEARLYTLQYLPALSILAASIAVPTLALLTASDATYMSPLAIWAVSLVYTIAVIMNFRGKGRSFLESLKILGTSSAIGLAVAPVIVKGVLLGIMNLRPRVSVTPKGSEDREVYREYVEEYLISLLSLCLGLLALLQGYHIASIVGFLPIIALAYTILRATKPLNL